MFGIPPAKPAVPDFVSSKRNWASLLSSPGALHVNRPWALSGGAIVYNLDWSYTVGAENGTKQNPTVAKTSSGPAFRHVSIVCTVGIDRMAPAGTVCST